MKRFLLLIGFMALFSGCLSTRGPGTETGGNPAAPPAPPAEIPAALIFPESVAISVDSLGKGLAPSALSVGDDVGTEVIRLRDGTRALSGMVGSLLAPLHQLIIPVGPQVRNYRDIVFVKKSLIGVKIDFADFDYDDDGHKEGCSGHTAALPICFRVWANEERYMSGVFDAFPTDVSPGAGRFRGVPILGGDGPSAAIYDHQDPLDKFTNFFFAEVNVAGLGERSHAQLTQVGPEGSAKKTVSGNHIGADSSFENRIGQFTENEDYLSMTLQTGDPMWDFTNACINLLSFDAVETDFCTALGLDVGGLPFLDGATQSDLGFSSDFPLTPTFY